MRHALPSDLAWIDDALDDWHSTLRWDIKGHTPSLPSLVSRLWDGVATQRVSEDVNGRPCGLLQLVDVDLVNGTGRVEAIIRTPAEAPALWRVFLARVFDDFPLRVGYVFVNADNLDVPVVAPYAQEVGRLPGHSLRGCGRYEDVVIHEIKRKALGGRTRDFSAI